jgi:hypothetical protein
MLLVSHELRASSFELPVYKIPLKRQLLYLEMMIEGEKRMLLPS